ncbi:histidine phosphotransferase family protein [Hwanghaeella sp.]|uniref:histidine phosphotransferase family protein n=1 Tax=Hwanghaeella sp. TaxID=2605943 RepID=UPI003CCBCD27
MNQRIAEMLMSRMAHELAGPVGAIANGVEFMQEVEEGATDAIDLIADSARRAAGRLQFYRLAYGGAGRSTSDETVILEAARGFVDEGGVVLTWPSGSAVDLIERPGGAKLLLVAVEIARGALLRGGTVEVDALPGMIQVAATGPKPTLAEEIRANFTGSGGVDDVEVTARSVHCLYARLLAAEAGVRLALAQDGEQIRLSIVF